ncbi:MAG TPA: hypothetical protein VIW64_06290 [Pyrinomonadaceae bacterium]
MLPKSSDEEREDWMRLSLESLSQAYSDDEREYSWDLIEEANPKAFRSEGPTISSPVRQGGDFQIPIQRGPKGRH